LPASSDFKGLIKHEKLAVHGIIAVPENLCDTPKLFHRHADMDKSDKA